MQGLADGYFILPHTIGHYLASAKLDSVSTGNPEFKRVEAEVRQRVGKLLNVNGKRSADSFHRELGLLLWEHCGMSRNASGLRQALQRIPELREEFWNNVRIPGEGQEFNMALEYGGRVADFMEFGELLCRDALAREESCGGHFREEFQTEDAEALRDDENFSHVAAWEYQGPNKEPLLHKELLHFEDVKLATRSYK